MRRLLSCMIVSFSVAATSAAYAAGLTEAEAVQRALAQSEITTLLDARRGIAAGNAESVGRWANPEIEYSQETLDLPGGPSKERSIWLRQRLNIAGVPGLKREAADHTRNAEDARTALVAREIASEIRTRFYQTLAADATVDIISHWHQRLEELSTAVSNRVVAGDASRYDQSRLERELALLQGEMLEANAQAASVRDQLFSLMGSEPVTLQGTLLPPAADHEVLAEVLANHPLLRALNAEAESAALSAKASRREAWPEVTVSIGRREYAEPGIDADGNILSLGVEIPLFDRGTGNARAHKGRASQLRAERALSEARLAADIRATLRTLESRRQAALALRTAGADASHSLAAIAESAYAAGEIGVMELIDAHRTELAARQEAITRALAARKAYIELQLLKGDLQ